MPVGQGGAQLVEIAGLQSGVITNLNVAQSAVALPTSASSTRRAVRIWNPSGNQTVFVGYNNSVTAGAPSNGGAQGVPVTAGSVVTFSVNSTTTLFGISSSGTNVVQVEELG